MGRAHSLPLGIIVYRRQCTCATTSTKLEVVERVGVHFTRIGKRSIIRKLSSGIIVPRRFFEVSGVMSIWELWELRFLTIDSLPLGGFEIYDLKFIVVHLKVVQWRRTNGNVVCALPCQQLYPNFKVICMDK